MRATLQRATYEECPFLEAALNRISIDSHGGFFGCVPKDNLS
jgi:hypothetical protein